MQGGLGGESQHRTLIYYVAQRDSGEESDMADEEKTMAEKEVHVSSEEKLEEIDLGMDPQKPRPISINSKLSKEEKSKLISLLKEFKENFAWE